MKNLVYAITVLVAISLAMPQTKANLPLQDEHGVVVPVILASFNGHTQNHTLAELPNATFQPVVMAIRIVDQENNTIYEKIYHQAIVTLPALTLSPGNYLLVAEVNGMTSSAEFVVN